jgi:coenzyme F420-reducing hydrogenase delta subunit
LNPISGYYDTLAHILYRLGYNEEAIKTQEMAIDKAKSEKTAVTNLESELKKIKAKTL